MRPSRPSSARAQVDDAAEFGSAHARQHGLRALQDGAEVQRHHLIDVVHGQVLGRPRDRDRGVVDKAQHAVLGSHALQGLAQRPCIGEVDGKVRALEPRAGARARQAQHVMATRRHVLGNGLADAFAHPRHHRHRLFHLALLCRE
jgi:hypothetical protein